MPAQPPPDSPRDPESPHDPEDRRAPESPAAPSTFGDGLRLAVGTLSVFPVRPGTVDRRAGGRAMALAPLVGAALGAVAAAVLAGALFLGVSPLLASLLAVGTLALLTRALHLDGLADLADGLGSGRPAGQALDIMKRSDIGPFGVVTLVFVLGVQVVALAEVSAAGHGPVALVAACVAGRLAITWACHENVPAARPGGLGATVAGTVRRGPALAATALSLAGLAVLSLAHHTGALDLLASSGSAADRRYADYSPADSVEGEIASMARGFVIGVENRIGPCPGPSCPLEPGLVVGESDPVVLLADGLLGGAPFPLVLAGLPLALATGLLAASALRRRAVRRLGGITGDVLGALAETAAAAMLVACAFLW
ncbi:adenosylcobinamide-GDP ribazoletransferase [Planomonospora corallina]|uniref:Adenosylcobinamide-GDP ribazoletransferase n=1 Tax=Planomonospora corallina TaxID=1806052 RepID=A0ABV8I6M2_9ACTN